MKTNMIITGTSRGIGQRLAVMYSAYRYEVYGCSRRDITSGISHYHHFCLDVSNEEQVKSMVNSVPDDISVLINNAGMASMNLAMLTPLSTVKNIMETNFYGTFLFCREVGKRMMRTKHGRIINFVSIASPLSIEGESIYAASKYAIESFTKILARELGKYNITCNSVGPSIVETDLTRSVPKDKLQEIVERLAIKRFATASDIKHVIDFFITNDYVTGQTIYLGGV